MKYRTCKLKFLEETGFWKRGQSFYASAEQFYLFFFSEK